MLRREFLLTATAAPTWCTLDSPSLFAMPACIESAQIRRNPDCPIPYENNIRDRTWMRGHDSGSLGHYIPNGARRRQDLSRGGNQVHGDPKRMHGTLHRYSPAG
jgi:hypothetical protein